MGYNKEQPSYFRTVYGRGHFKYLFHMMIYAILTPFRLILEVFIRRHMGERYFSGFFCLVWSLIFLSGFIEDTMNLSFMIPESYTSNNAIGIFGMLFLGFSIWRWVESYHNPSTVSFDKFSKSSGEPTLIFKTLLNKGTSPRLIEVWLEPLFFTLIGGVLTLFVSTRLLGAFLIICSIIYALSYRSAYALARDYILDKIDEKISGEALGQVLKSGMAEHKARGFLNRAPIPTDEEHRKQLYDLILEQDKSGEPTSVAK